MAQQLFASAGGAISGQRVEQAVGSTSQQVSGSARGAVFSRLGPTRGTAEKRAERRAQAVNPYTKDLGTASASDRWVHDKFDSKDQYVKAGHLKR